MPAFPSSPNPLPPPGPQPPFSGLHLPPSILGRAPKDLHVTWADLVSCPSPRPWPTTLLSSPPQKDSPTFNPPQPLTLTPNHPYSSIEIEGWHLVSKKKEPTQKKKPHTPFPPPKLSHRILSHPWSSPHSVPLRKRRCFRCRDLGHMAYNCRNAVVCARCGSLGHYSYSCSQRLAPSGRQASPLNRRTRSPSRPAISYRGPSPYNRRSRSPSRPAKHHHHTTHKSPSPIHSRHSHYHHQVSNPHHSPPTSHHQHRRNTSPRSRYPSPKTYRSTGLMPHSPPPLQLPSDIFTSLPKPSLPLELPSPSSIRIAPSSELTSELSKLRHLAIASVS